MLRTISNPGLMDLITEFKNYAAMAPDEAARKGPFDKYWLILAALRELQLHRSKRPLSKAEVAREFLEVLCDRGPLAVRADGLQRKVKGYGEEILKEWEDAESK